MSGSAIPRNDSGGSAAADGGDSGSTTRLRHGTPAFRRATSALVAVGFATFTLLYCVQPLLPVFSGEFGVSAAVSSLALSLSTGLLAPMLIVVGALSESLGRKGLMIVSLAATAALTIAAALTPDFSGLLIARALTGIAISGLPAVAMAYLGEEVEPRSLGFATGVLIAGNALGGMFGRVAVGVFTDFASWRVALGAVGVFGLAVSLVVVAILPPSKHFIRRPLRAGATLGAFVAHLREPGLRMLFALGFLLMGGFVSLYNYIGYRLEAPPYQLSQSAVGAVFAVYLIGSASSAWMGRLADRLGRRRVLWVSVLIMLAGILMTLAHALALVILGIAVATFGFFGGHSIASSWVARRAHFAKGQASSLYLFAYYLGSSAVGSASGLAWMLGGWTGVVAALSLLILLALGLSFRLARLQPLPEA